MRLRDRLAELARPPAPPARVRYYHPKPPGPPEPQTFPFGPLQLADTWGKEFELWRGNKLSLTVIGNSCQVQLARSIPPAPAVWDRPFTLLPGPYSHVGPFGYFRFKNDTPGLASIVQGTAFSE